MIEEINKGIFTEKYIIHDTYINLDVIGVNDLKKVLDKYNMMYPDYKDLLYQNDSLHSELQELKDYKKMWEELSKRAYITREFVRGPKEMNNKLLELIQELEQKYNLGGE